MTEANKQPLEPSPYVEKLAYATIGAAIEVHRAIGPGFKEQPYEKALCIELGLRNIPFQAQAPIELTYKNAIIGKGKIDILVSEILIVELKSVSELLDVHRAQVAAYLKAANLHLGLLLNFNTTVLKPGIERIINPYYKPSI